MCLLHNDVVVSSNTPRMLGRDASSPLRKFMSSCGMLHECWLQIQMFPKFMMMIIIIINGANWFFISHLCSFLMWSCSLLPLPILAIQTLASSLYLCSPFVVPSIRPFPLPIPAILSSLPLSPTSQKCNNAFGATVGGRNVASILSVFGPEVQSLPPHSPQI